MSLKTQNIEWYIPEDEVFLLSQVGIEVELSPSPTFYPITYRFNTYADYDDKIHHSLTGRFYYSFDGNTWYNFPTGQGFEPEFNQAYWIRLTIKSGDGNGYIYAKCNDAVYKLSGDGYSQLKSIDALDSTDFDINYKNNELYLSGTNKTIYRFNSDLSYNTSFNIHENPLGIVVDGTRNLLWQINDDQVILRDATTGYEISAYALDYVIETDWSSSSSSS